jgi:hypothetical protein
MSLSPQAREWLNWVLITSVPLRQVENGQVVGRAAGTLVDYGGRRFLLSVEHAVKRGSTGWAIELGYDSNLGTEVYWPNEFVYIGEFTRSTTTLRELDLCLAEVPRSLEPKYEYRTPRGLFDQRPRHIFTPDFSAKPDPQGVYAFSGQVKPEQHAPNVVAFEMVVYPGLKYLRSENELHVFQLPVAHPGHDAFHGCSGGPIVDMNKNVVALVTGGDGSANTVSGISLQRCLPGLNFLCSGGSGT